MWSFVASFFPSAKCFQGSSRLYHITMFHFFNVNKYPIDGHTTFYLSFHQSMDDIWIVSTFLLSGIMLL